MYNKILNYLSEVNSENEKSLKSYDDVDNYKNEFLNAMDDDLNTALALSYILQMLKLGNSSSDLDKKIYVKNVIIDLLQNIFGLKLLKEEKENKEDEVIKILINLRNEFKKQSNFEVSDFIRDQLAKDGIILIDGRDGTSYKIKQ